MIKNEKAESKNEIGFNDIGKLFDFFISEERI